MHLSSSRRHHVLALCVSLLASCIPLLVVPGQSPPAQDPTLDNLQHGIGTLTAPNGSLGRVTETGDGPVSLVLVPPLGFAGEHVLVPLQSRPGQYRFAAVTLAGLGGTPPPPMPPAGTSYGEQTWIHGAVTGLRAYLARTQGGPALVVGHGGLGGRVAIRLAALYPEVVSGLVLVGAEPARALTPVRDLSPDERRAAVDGPLADGWFRTVTKTTWDANMWVGSVYTRDTALAPQLWGAVADVPLPTMIRYLNEFLAGDDREALANLRVPVLVIRPGFTETFRADTTNRNALRLIRDGWSPAMLDLPHVEVHDIPDANLFVMHDQAEAFLAAIDRFAERLRQ